jgi:hypothetical protein
MTPMWTNACCSKGARQLGNILYCFKCGATKAVALATPAEDPLQLTRRKYDGMQTSTLDRGAQVGNVAHFP